MPGFDLTTYGSGWGFVPGSSTGHVNIIGRNLRCLPTNGQLKLVASDPLITYNNSGGNPPDQINGDTLVWNFSNLHASISNWWGSHIWQGGKIFDTDTTATLSDTICFTLIICPETGDVDVTNNLFELCVPVVASYDPNNKQVSPLGVGNTGDIEVDRQMTYTINFQNTGTAPALNIFLRDTIDINVLGHFLTASGGIKSHRDRHQHH